MPSRRLLLRVTTSGALALGVVALGGCRIQLEQDAQIPFITRTLMPDESALLTAYRQVSELAALAARTNSPDAAVIAARHTRCLLYTSPSPRDSTRYRIPSSA